MGDDDDFWDDLLECIRDQKLVTVTGPDLSVVNGTDQTLTTLIAQGLAEKYPLDVSPGAKTMGEAVAALMERDGGLDKALQLKRDIFKIISKLDPKPGEPLKNLAAISDLRLFVNTTPDQLLVQAVHEDGSRDTSAIWEITFSPTLSTEEQGQQLSAKENAQNHEGPPATDTVVLNLFGRANRLGQYVIHEEDRLEYLHAQLSDQATFPDWLNKRLRSQPMLFVGCEIPDWIGRFLVRRIANERLSGDELKPFFFVNSSTSEEPALTSFFKTYCREARVQQLPKAPIEFVAELRTRWDKLSPTWRRPAPEFPDSPDPPAPDAPTIFISYMREDLEAAWQLRNAITEIGWSVWLDKREIRPGDPWAAETLATIDSKAVRLFIPVISAKTEREREGFVFAEWRAAVARYRQMMDRFLVPVTIDGHYDPDSYTRIRKVFPEFKAPDWGHAPGGAPDQTLLALLRDEIRALRKAGAK